jgi:flagellar biosynthesis/type III secretory pathway M-ring protein FliF/YscJ
MKRLTNNDVLLKQVTDKVAFENTGGRDKEHLRLTNQSAGSGEGTSGAGEFDQEIEIPSTMARDKKIEVIKSVVDNDPRVAAQVVKSWVAEGE